MNDHLLEVAVGAIVAGIITALFNVFTRMRLLESAVRVVQAEALKDVETRKETGRKMEVLGQQMVELGREMSDVAAVIRIAVTQNQLNHK